MQISSELDQLKEAHDKNLLNMQIEIQQDTLIHVGPENFMIIIRFQFFSLAKRILVRKLRNSLQREFIKSNYITRKLELIRL